LNRDALFLIDLLIIGGNYFVLKAFLEKIMGTGRGFICKFVFKPSELSAKEKIIEDMRMTLEEQEQTQIEQEQVLEAKLEENSRLVSGNLSRERKQGGNVVFFIYVAVATSIFQLTVI